MDLIKTSRGLPNTCSNCGGDPGAFWFAANDDQARAGQGLCKDCAYPKAEKSEEKQPPESKDSGKKS
ncbi:MAG: hypothetical protein L0219_07340 [Phycisphaerales bacterium]|nr:hypothetical protein [Phycisphaerales bacterium]